MSEMFGFIKTSMIELFDDRYANLSDVVVAVATMAFSAARILGERVSQY